MPNVSTVIQLSSSVALQGRHSGWGWWGNSPTTFLHCGHSPTIFCGIRKCKVQCINSCVSGSPQKAVISTLIALLPKVTRRSANQVFHCVLHQLLLVVPATSVTSERSFSSLRLLKTFFRTMMSQSRLNHLMLLYVHKDYTIHQKNSYYRIHYK